MFFFWFLSLFTPPKETCLKSSNQVRIHEVSNFKHFNFYFRLMH